MQDLTPETLAGDSVTAPRPMYSNGQVSLAAMLGGALAGTWIMLRSVEALDEPSRRKRVLLAGLALTLGFSMAILLAPTDFPSRVFAAIPLLLFAGWYQLELGDAFRKHVDDGGAKGSWFRATGIGVVGGVTWVALLVVAQITLPLTPVNHVKAGPHVLYYEGGADRGDAQRLAEFLFELGFFRDDSEQGGEMTLLFPKAEPKTVVLGMPIAEELWSPALDSELKVLAAYVRDELYLGWSVEIHLLSLLGTTEKVIRPEPPENDDRRSNPPYRQPSPWREPESVSPDR